MRDGRIESTSADLATGLRALQHRNTVAWFEVTPEELDDLAGPLQLHAHVVEDARQTGDPTGIAGRTRLERYPSLSSMTLYRTALRADGDLELTEIGVFVTPSFVVVVHRQAFAHDEVGSRWLEHPELARHGTSGLLQAVLDLVIDSHLETVDVLADRVDDMEDVLFDGAASNDDDPRELARRSFTTRKSLVRLRRITQPMREAVGGIMRADEDDATPVHAALLPYYQDLYDHVLRVNDTIEGLRDLLTTMYETRLAMADHTLNMVMKKLTGWAAIIAVVTAVTGFYGQNVPYPGFARPWGFWTSTIVWVTLSGLLFAVLRRRRWI